jgi:hypothetical protein
VKLQALAHARTGDKGDTANVAVIAYRAADYAFLAEQLTAARVASHLAGLVHGEVTRHELPRIGVLNFVLRHALGGGVTRSLALDAHGKSLGFALLDLELPEPAASPAAADPESPPWRPT